jgi:hypothetical protein
LNEFWSRIEPDAAAGNNSNTIIIIINYSGRRRKQRKQQLLLHFKPFPLDKSSIITSKKQQLVRVWQDWGLQELLELHLLLFGSQLIP